MQKSLPIGSLIAAILWLLIIPAVFLIVIRVFRKRFFGEKKEPISDLENKLLTEIKDSYDKLSEEQKKKIDSIK